MKTLFLAAGLVLLFPPARAEELTAADREALLEKLDKIQEDADQKIDAKFRAAVAAYRSAMTSPAAAVEFYVKCVEKVNFTDQKKKDSEFREWKKKESDKLRNPAFGRALCHQLRWLVLSLRAASEKADKAGISRDAREAMEAVFLEAPSLEGQHQLLSQNVMGTIFTKTYEISGFQPKNFPGSPVQISEIFEQLLMPPLRNPSSLDALRSAWLRRIQLEGVTVKWNNGGEKDSPFGKPAGPTPAQEKFSTETLPALQWEMEKDLFSAGDERGASLRMMTLIESHPLHKSAGGWRKELRSLITAPQEETPASAEGE